MRSRLWDVVAVVVGCVEQMSTNVRLAHLVEKSVVRRSCSCGWLC